MHSAAELTGPIYPPLGNYVFCLMLKHLTSDTGTGQDLQNDLVKFDTNL